MLQMADLTDKSDRHVKWLDVYKTPENDRYSDKVIDYLTRILNAPPGSTILDAGCGNCDDSIRLAKRGFCVEASDFSESALEMAKNNVRSAGFEDKIKIQHEDVCELSYDDNMFYYIFCAAVLTTIPDIESAMSELSRVLKPGGRLIVSEHNMYSLQLIITRSVKKIIGKEPADTKITPAGFEVFHHEEEGIMMTRQTNIKWLINEFSSHGLELRKRIPGQFTQAYARHFSLRGKKFIHWLNNLWFDYIKIPHFAMDNILIFEKPKHIQVSGKQYLPEVRTAIGRS